MNCVCVRQAPERVGEPADVGLVERGIDLVEDAERHRPDLEHREQQRDRRQGALAARQHRERLRLLARWPRHDLDTGRRRDPTGRSATVGRSRRRTAAGTARSNADSSASNVVRNWSAMSVSSSTISSRVLLDGGLGGPRPASRVPSRRVRTSAYSLDRERVRRAELVVATPQLREAAGRRRWRRSAARRPRSCGDDRERRLERRRLVAGPRHRRPASDRPAPSSDRVAPSAATSDGRHAETGQGRGRPMPGQLDEHAARERHSSPSRASSSARSAVRESVICSAQPLARRGRRPLRLGQRGSGPPRPLRASVGEGRAGRLGRSARGGDVDAADALAVRRERRSLARRAPPLDARCARCVPRPSSRPHPPRARRCSASRRRGVVGRELVPRGVPPSAQLARLERSQAAVAVAVSVDAVTVRRRTSRVRAGAIVPDDAESVTVGDRFAERADLGAEPLAPGLVPRGLAREPPRPRACRRASALPRAVARRRPRLRAARLEPGRRVPRPRRRRPRPARAVRAALASTRIDLGREAPCSARRSRIDSRAADRVTVATRRPRRCRHAAPRSNPGGSAAWSARHAATSGSQTARASSRRDGAGRVAADGVAEPAAAGGRDRVESASLGRIAARRRSPVDAAASLPTGSLRRARPATPRDRVRGRTRRAQPELRQRGLDRRAERRVDDQSVVQRAGRRPGALPRRSAARSSSVRRSASDLEPAAHRRAGCRGRRGSSCGARALLSRRSRARRRAASRAVAAATSAACGSSERGPARVEQRDGLGRVASRRHPRLVALSACRRSASASCRRAVSVSAWRAASRPSQRRQLLTARAGPPYEAPRARRWASARSRSASATAASRSRSRSGTGAAIARRCRDGLGVGRDTLIVEPDAVTVERLELGDAGGRRAAGGR